jgi:hypothetical protein
MATFLISFGLIVMLTFLGLAVLAYLDCDNDAAGMSVICILVGAFLFSLGMADSKKDKRKLELAKYRIITEAVVEREADETLLMKMVAERERMERLAESTQ